MFFICSLWYSSEYHIHSGAVWFDYPLHERIDDQGEEGRRALIPDCVLCAVPMLVIFLSVPSEVVTSPM